MVEITGPKQAEKPGKICKKCGTEYSIYAPDGARCNKINCGGVITLRE